MTSAMSSVVQRRFSAAFWIDERRCSSVHSTIQVEIDRARRHRIDTHLRGEPAREVLRQADDASFRRGVGKAAAGASDASNRCGVDDGAVGGLERRGRSLGAAENAEQVDLQQRRPQFLGHEIEFMRFDLAACAGGAGVGDE